MFATFKQVFKSTNKDLRKRIGYTLAALFIFALGNAITVPGMSKITTDLGFLELLNAMSGGGLKQFSIFALGVMPYISASILMQILQMDIIPYFKELKELGEEGRNKINKITRYVGIGFALVEGFVYAVMFMGKTAAPMEYLYTATILTAGTAFLLWLGDQITQKGIGNGVSLLIMAGIVNTLPSMFITAFKELVPGASSIWIGILSFALFIILYVAIIVGVIFVNEAERRISIQYSNRTNSSYGGKQTFLPIKVNSAGVMPVIFASTVMAIPSLISSLAKSEKVTNIINSYFSTSTVVGFSIYVVLIILFAYIYTFITLNPEEMAKNLNKNGGYIPGVRPGADTQKYISTILGRITLLGALFVAVLASLPTLFTAMTDLPSSVKVGGTSILIVVGVMIELYKQLESSVASRNYNFR